MDHFIIESYKRESKIGTYDTIKSMFSCTNMMTFLVGLYIGAFHGMSFTDAVNFSSNGDTKPISDYLSISYYENPTITENLVSIMHYMSLVSEWKKSKQVYKFNRDLLNELSETDIDFTLPHDIFKRLPYQTLYLDFSDNRELCSKISADGCIITPRSTMIMIGGEIKQFTVLMIVTYRGGKSVISRAITLPNESDGFSISADDLCAEFDDADSESIVYDGARLQTIVVMQAILYLCSYEPDIRESSSSKAERRTAKRLRIKKSDMPAQTYEVGVRFGAAFRKWTAGTLGADHSTGTGSHKRPHMRRAHWHRFWTGKRNSDERKLIIKWVSECFCGIAEGETDKMSAVQHKVS